MGLSWFLAYFPDGSFASVNVYAFGSSDRDPADHSFGVLAVHSVSRDIIPSNVIAE